VADTIEQALRAIAGAGKCGGTIALTPEDEDRYAAFGARFFASVTTSIITQAFQRAAAGGKPRQAVITY